MKEQINKIVSVVVLMFLLTSCHRPPKGYKEGDYDRAFMKYLTMRKIEFTELNNSLYSKYYIDFMRYERKELLLKNPFLKFNQVYVHQTNNIIRYFVFTDIGYVYAAETDRDGSAFVSEPAEGKIKVKKPFPLLLYGFYELEDRIVRISRNEVQRYGELNQCDVGIMQNDTITLTAYYNTKKFGYKKKWLAKTHKTNFKLVHQPNLTATPIKHDFWGKTFRIEGEFNDERVVEEEKMFFH